MPNKKAAPRRNPARESKTRPVLVPVDNWSRPYADSKAARVSSGTTSIRVSNATKALLDRLIEDAAARAKAAGNGWYARAIGYDELLYFDALDRLGEFPDAVACQYAPAGRRKAGA